MIQFIFITKLSCLFVLVDQPCTDLEKMTLDLNLGIFGVSPPILYKLLLSAPGSGLARNQENTLLLISN